MSKVFIEELEQRVEKGIRYLDRTKKGWEKVIELDVLNLQDTDDCVLGFVFKGFWKKVVDPWDGDERNTLKGQLSLDEATRMGFALRDSECENGWYDYLTRLWYIKIFNRLHRKERKP